MYVIIKNKKKSLFITLLILIMGECIVLHIQMCVVSIYVNA